MNSIKPSLTILFSIFFIHIIFAAPTSKNLSHSQVLDKTMSVEEVINMNARTYQSLTGERMKIKDRIALNFVKAELKLRVHSGEDLSNGIAMGQAMDNFSIVGFLLGLFLGLLGVLISLLWSDKKVRKSAWKGVLVWLLILIIWGVNIRD